MMKRLLILITAVILLLLIYMVSQGIKVNEFKFMNFEDVDDIIVTDMGLPQSGMDIAAREMPIAYQLERSDYTVKIRVDFDNGLPAIVVKALSKNGDTLTIKGVKHGRCADISFLNTGFEDELDFMWWGDRRPQEPSCQKQAIRKADSIMVFVVKDDNGEIHEERLPFELMPNGYYIEIDAL